MIVLGGALAMCRFQSRDETEAVDVILEPSLGAHRNIIHNCIQQVAKTENLRHDWMTTDHYEKRFKREVPNDIFQRCACDEKKSPKLYSGTKLYVYFTDTKLAPENEGATDDRTKARTQPGLKDNKENEGRLKQDGVDEPNSVPGMGKLQERGRHTGRNVERAVRQGVQTTVKS